MKGSNYLPLYIGGLLAMIVVFITPAISKPATSSDLSGKKICWSDGDAWTFSPGGKLDSSQWGNGNWALSAVGVKITVTRGSTVATIDKLGDGTFHVVYEGQGNFKRDLTGQTCK